MADIDIVDAGLLLHAVELELNEPADFRRNPSRIVCRRLIESDVVVLSEAGRRPAWLRHRGAGEGRYRGPRQRQPMILAVAADITVQLEVAPLGRQMRTERPDMAGGA